MLAAPETPPAFPDMEPLESVTPLDVAETIQRVLDTLGQQDPFKQSLDQRPPILRRCSIGTATANQGPPDELSSTIYSCTPSPTPSPPLLHQVTSLQVSCKDDLPVPSFTRGSQINQARTPEAGDTPTQVADHPGSPKQTYSIPPGIFEAFKAHRPLLERRSERGMPELYETWNSFWIPRKSNFFILMGASTTSENTVITSGGEGLAETTLSLCNPSFFFWDPRALAIGGIRCPSPGCSKSLSAGSLLKEPRPVVFGSTSAPNRETMYDGMFWIIGVKYICDHCADGKGLSYKSWDPRLLARLPALLRAEFPAVERHGHLVALPHVVSNTGCDSWPSFFFSR